jgi:hypothetical protein
MIGVTKSVARIITYIEQRVPAVLTRRFPEQLLLALQIILFIDLFPQVLCRVLRFQCYFNFCILE